MSPAFHPTFSWPKLAKYLLVASVLLACGFPSFALAPPETSQTAASLEITLEPSRSQPTAGSGGIMIGTVKNTSQVPVLICEHTTTLTAPNELNQVNYPSFDYATFTALGNGRPDYKSVLILGPGQSTHAFWNFNQSYAHSNNWYAQTDGSPLWTQIKTEFGYMFFQPGVYKFSVQAKFWPLPRGRTLTKEALENANYDVPGYQNAVTAIAIPVSAPITVVLIGAALGGLLAFLLREFAGVSGRGPQSQLAFFQGWVRVAAGISHAIAAILLACIIVILFSRLAGTDFPIKVSVSDLWGAIGIGFVGTYSGTSILTRLLGMSESLQKKSLAKETAINSASEIAPVAEPPSN
jgi:hypothetical protein